MSLTGRSLARSVSHEAKIVILYCSALLGASLSEIQICRVGYWGCEPLRGAMFVFGGATPMLVALVLAPIGRYMLAIFSVIVGGTLLSLGLFAAQSDGSLTWPFVYSVLWSVGFPLAIAVFVIGKGFDFRSRAKDPLPLPVEKQLPDAIQKEDISVRPLTQKTKYTYLAIGAVGGTLLGKIEIYRTGQGDFRNLEDLSFIDALIFGLVFEWVLMLILVSFTLSPYALILHSKDTTKKELVCWTTTLGALVAICGMSLAHRFFSSDKWFAYNHNSGFLYLWLLGILTALVLLIRKPRRPPPVGERVLPVDEQFGA